MSSDLPEELLGIEDVLEDDEDETPEEEQRQFEEEEPEDRERFLLFEVGELTVAAEIENVRSIVEVGETTRVPRTSEAIDGLMDMRGAITAIVNPRVHFPVETDPVPREQQRVIVFDRPGDEQPIGIRVDHVQGVEAFPMSSIVPPTGETLEFTAAMLETDEGERVPIVDIEGLVQASGQAPA